LSFNKPLELSQTSDPLLYDRLNVQFVYPELFISKEGSIIESNLTLNETIPPQFPSESDAVLAEGIKNIMTTVEVFILTLAMLG
jgi:hypothetical protein